MDNPSRHGCVVSGIASASRTVSLLAAAILLQACSLSSDALPSALRYSAIDDINAFLPPSATPFLPQAATQTLPATLPPMNRELPASPSAETVIFADPATATVTILILPSVTPTNDPPAGFPTYAVPTWTTVRYPEATSTKAVPPVQKTATPADPVPLQSSPTSTSTDLPPMPEAPGQTGDATDVAPADPHDPLPSSTNTPLPTFTLTPQPTSLFPGCAYTLNPDYENQIFVRINQAREAAGLWDLAWYGPLAAGARYHSIDMGCNKYFAHTGGVGENILGGYNTVAEAWNWWWNSPPHHDNILGQYYYKVGVGYAWVPSGPYRYYWTIQFSR